MESTIASNKRLIKMKNSDKKTNAVCKQSTAIALLPCIVTLAILFFAASSHAQTTLNWGATGAGGTGTWDTTTADWYNSTLSSATTWGNVGGATGSMAAFGGTSGTVTIDSGGVMVGVGTTPGATFNTGGYVLTGGPMTVDFTGASADRIMYWLNSAGGLTINNNTILKTYSSSGAAFSTFSNLNAVGATMTINGNIGLSSAETGGTKYIKFLGGGWGTATVINGTIKDYDSAGSGAKLAFIMDSAAYQDVTLNAANSYTGGTQITKGALYVATNSALGTGGVRMNGGVTSLITAGNVTLTNSVDMNVASGGQAAVIGGSTAQVSTFSGNVVKYNNGGTGSNSQNLIMTAAAGGTFVMTGVMNDTGANNLLVTKMGQGVAKVTSANTYSGTTQINDGTYLVDNTAGSGTGVGAVYVNSVTATTTTAGVTYNSNVVTVADTSGLKVGQSVSGTSYIQSGSYIAAISNSTTLVLNKAGMNTGAASSLTFGAQAGTLGGTGTIAGATTVNAGATIAPGDLATGMLTLQSGLDLEGSYAWEIGANSAVTGFDSIALTGGNLTLGAGSVLNIAVLGGVDFSNSFWTSNHSWNVIDNSGTGLLSGTFGSLTGVTSNAEGYFSLTYGSGAGADATLNWTAVPEPTTWMLLGIGGLLLLLSRRSRKSVI